MGCRPNVCRWPCELKPRRHVAGRRAPRRERSRGAGTDTWRQAWFQRARQMAMRRVDERGVWVINRLCKEFNSSMSSAGTWQDVIRGYVARCHPRVRGKRTEDGRSHVERRGNIWRELERRELSMRLKVWRVISASSRHHLGAISGSTWPGRSRIANVIRCGFHWRRSSMLSSANRFIMFGYAPIVSKDGFIT